MELIKFDISSPFANFSENTQNSYKRTFEHIHRCTVLGIIGAIIGIEKDLPQMEGKKKKVKIEKTPSYYEKLKDIGVSIIPHETRYPKINTEITETTGMFNKRSNYVREIELLINPKWTIYLSCENNKYKNKIKEYLLERKTVFIPYLGVNSFQADITNVSTIEGEKAINLSTIKSIDSLFIESDIKHCEDEDNIRISSGVFYLPKGYNDRTKHYDIDRFIFTNDNVYEISPKATIIKADNKNLFFIV